MNVIIRIRIQNNRHQNNGWKRKNYTYKLQSTIIQYMVRTKAFIISVEQHNLTFTKGMKYSTKSLSLICNPILHSDSTALSLTQVSSTVQSISKGGSNTWACSTPPTKGMNTPNSSAIARSTSSSSSLFSPKNGINSLRVRSSPRALAIVESFLIEFNRSWMSSFFSSSMSTAIGYSGSSTIDIFFSFQNL